MRARRRDRACIQGFTSKVRDGFRAFASEEAKRIFWDRFEHYTQKYGFVPWIATLMNNHYHFEGYLKIGENLGPLMQHLHGSVAKLVNDILPERHLPFWRHRGNQDYFDGCLRDVLQAVRASGTRSCKPSAPESCATTGTTRTRVFTWMSIVA